jgi:phytol kinase
MRQPDYHLFADRISEAIPADLKVELIRKSIHMLIAFVPFLTGLLGREITFSLLAAGALFYTYAEILRSQGVQVAFISRVTCAAARNGDSNRLILGPVTLALGAMVSLLLYPETAASIAIYALAFGDSFSSIAGKLFGRIPLPLSGRKTFEGSLACFLSVLYVVGRMIGFNSKTLIIALAATLLEAIPLGDLDNIVLPIGTGFTASLLILN